MINWKSLFKIKITKILKFSSKTLSYVFNEKYSSEVFVILISIILLKFNTFDIL